MGPGAKVATLGNTFDGDPTRRPVIIFTADCNDEDDVRRVLVALRALGINDTLAYKTDEATELANTGTGSAPTPARPAPPSSYAAPLATSRLVDQP